MSKQESSNVFNEGLVMDLNPLTTPNNVLTNALNATLLTYNGNEFVLQNDLGNGRVETAKLPTGFVPLGVKEYGGIIYVASYNPITNEGQLGSFPSPERNLSQNELGKNVGPITKSAFCDQNGQIDKYYIRYDLMPEDMVLNPGDSFGIYISGGPTDIVSCKDSVKYRLVTFHPAILNDLGNVSYIDDECKVEGKLDRGIIFGSAPTGSVDDQAVFDNLLVYKGKKSGKLLLIVELETLEDFQVSRSFISHKDTSKSKVESTGSSKVGYSDDNTKGEDAEFAVKFYCSGWPKIDNDYIHFIGVNFNGNGVNQDFKISNKELQTLSFAYGGFKKGASDNILKYKITPYTELGPNAALARTGIINFNLLGTGNIILNEWRYYVEGNKLRLNYGFDINLLEGEYVSNVDMKFYDVFYGVDYSTLGHVFTCKSTLNGNFNGSYSEFIELPYDLKYTDKYDSNKDNLDYIYEDILESENKNIRLKGNQLLKNNFYLVKITLQTAGLVTESNTPQTSEKCFYRFLYTNGIFNKQYIEGEITNFSTIKVDPYEVAIKTNLSGDVDLSNEDDFEVEYYNSPTANGNKSGIQFADPNDQTAIITYKQDPLKANLYQDWGLKANCKMKLTADLKNINSDVALEGDSYYMFGEYAEGFYTVNSGNLSASSCKVTYDNSGFSAQTFGGSPGDKESHYVDITKNWDDAPNNLLVDYKEVRGSLSDKLKEDILGKETYTKSTDSATLKTFEDIKDRQFYSVSGDFTPDPIENDKETTINIPPIYGRLIRRAASNGEFSNREMNCEECRPCFYPTMEKSALDSVLLKSGGINSFGNLSDSGMQVTYCGDHHHKDDNKMLLSSSKNNPKTSETDTSLFASNEDGTDGTGFFFKGSHAAIVRELAKNIEGGQLSHCAVWPFTNKLWSKLTDTEMYKAFTPGVYRPASGSSYNSSMFTALPNYKKLLHYRWGATSALWRTNSSTEANPDYVFINLGGSTYDYFRDYLQKVLQSIYIVQPKVIKTLAVRDSSRYVYSNIYPTKVNVGISVGTVKDGTTTIDGITINHSPVKLYTKKAGETRYFDKTVVEKEKPQDWNLTEDKWYKSLEDLSGSPTEEQCTYNNIPYNSKEKDIKIDSSNLLVITDDKESNICLGFTMLLGNSMDVTTIISKWGDNPTSDVQYIYMETAANKYEKIEFTDHLGVPLNKNIPYFLTADSKLISGDSDQIKNTSLKYIKYRDSLKGMFSLKEFNGNKIPVINKENFQAHSYAYFVPTHNKMGSWKHFEKCGDNQWPYYKDIYFGISSSIMAGTGDFVSNVDRT